MFISNVIDSSLLIHARRYCHYISIHTLVYKPQHLCGLLDTFIWVSGVDVGLNVKMRIANVCQRRFLLIREGSVNLRVRRLFTLKFKLVICYPEGSGNSTLKAPVMKQPTIRLSAFKRFISCCFVYIFWTYLYLLNCNFLISAHH